LLPQLNTIPVPDVSEHPKFVQLSIAETFAEAINRITTNRSISELFTEDGEKKMNDLSAAALEPAAVTT